MRKNSILILSIYLHIKDRLHVQTHLALILSYTVDLSRQQNTREEYRKTSWVLVELLDLSRCTSTLLLLLLDDLQTIFRKIDARHDTWFNFFTTDPCSIWFIAQSFQKINVKLNWVETSTRLNSIYNPIVLLCA